MKHIELFDLIAPIYALFYSLQHKAYKRVLPYVNHLDTQSKVLDLACGTGGLTGILNSHFKSIIAIDGSQKMLKEAKRLHPHQSIEWVQHNLLDGLDYPNQSFDLISTAFFLHGIKQEERLFILNEMKRVSKSICILDYYGPSHLMIDIVEKLEGGDYFNFKKQFEEELKQVFDTIRIIPLHKNVALYLNY